MELGVLEKHMKNLNILVDWKKYFRFSIFETACCNNMHNYLTKFNGKGDCKTIHNALGLDIHYSKVKIVLNLANTM